jgi:uncharacterized protein
VLVVGLALAALVGISLGMTGGGGSILTVPIFVYVLGYDPKTAIAMSLPVIGITSLVGARAQWRAGQVDVKTAILFGVVAIVGAFLGARAAVFVDGAVQLILLAVVMLAAAVMMFRSGRAASQHGPSGRAEPSAQSPALTRLIPIALAVGLLTGLVGIGGGFLVVPALVLLTNAPMKQAIGTSLLVIAMNAASGFAGYVGQVSLPWNVLAMFTAIAVGGMLVGTTLAKSISQSALKQGFAVFLVLMSGFVLYKNRGVFSRRAPDTHSADVRQDSLTISTLPPHVRVASALSQ